MKNILEIYRVKDWYYYLGFILLGFSVKSNFLSIDIIRYIILGIFLLAYAFSLNDYYDKHEKKKFFIIPLIFTFLILPLFNFSQIIVSLIFVTIVTLYSAYPFRLKAKPFICSFCNGFGFTLLFFLGYFYTSTLNLKGILFASLLFCFNMVAQFIHEVVDYKEDRKSKITTTAILCGIRKMKIICIFLLFLSIILSISICSLERVNSLFFIFTLIFSLFFMFRIYKRKFDKNLRKIYKACGIVLGCFYFFLMCL